MCGEHGLNIAEQIARRSTERIDSLRKKVTFWRIVAAVTGAAAICMGAAILWMNIW